MSTPDGAVPAVSRRGRPKSDDLRRRLLEAAIPLLASRGVDRTTTREIAARAGTTERTLFQHFGSKDGLVEAVVDRAILAHTVPDSLAELAADIAGFDGDLQRWHCRLLSSRLAAWRQAGELTRLLLVEALRHPPVLERFVHDWRAAAWEPLVALFEAQQAAGLLRRDVAAPVLVSQFIAVNVSFLLMRVVVAPAALDDDSDIAAIALLFAKGAAAPTGAAGLP